MVTIDPLNASKIPKLRYAWTTDGKMTGWTKLKFKLRLLAGSDNFVGYSGQTIFGEVQGNDYNPSKLSTTVTYIIGDGEPKKSLRMKHNDKLRVNVSCSNEGVVMIEPVESFTGPAFPEKISARVTSADGSSEDVSFSATFIPTAGQAAKISYRKVNLDSCVFGSIWEGNDITKLAKFTFRGRAYNCGDVVYFPNGLICVKEDGSFVFSPNLSAKVSKDDEIGDIYCYSSESGDPYVLSLQYDPVPLGPFFVRGDIERRFNFNLNIPEGYSVVKYRTVNTSTAANKKMSWNHGKVLVNGDGTGYIESGSKTFVPLTLELINVTTNATRSCTLHIVICDDMAAASLFHDRAGNLLTDKPKSAVLTSYTLETDHVMPGTVASLGNNAAFVAKSDGSYTAWISSAYVGKVMVNYTYSIAGRSVDGSVEISADPKSSHAPSKVFEIAPAATSLESSLIAESGEPDEVSKMNQRRAASSAANGRSNSNRRRDRSPNKVEWEGVTSYSMYPDGTVLHSELMLQMGDGNFEKVKVGDLVGYTMKAERLETQYGIFRRVPLALEKYCNILAVLGAKITLTVLAGATAAIMPEPNDAVELRCSNGNVTLEIIKELAESARVIVYGVFRRSAIEPEYFHKFTVDLQNTNVGTEIISVKFNPDHGIVVQPPLSIGDVDLSKQTDAKIGVKIGSGSCTLSVRFVPDSSVDTPVELVTPIEKFVSISEDVPNGRCISIIGDFVNENYASGAIGIKKFVEDYQSTLAPAA